MSRSLLGTLVALGVCLFLSSCATAPTEGNRGENIHSHGIDSEKKDSQFFGVDRQFFSGS